MEELSGTVEWLAVQADQSLEGLSEEMVCDLQRNALVLPVYITMSRACPDKLYV